MNDSKLYLKEESYFKPLFNHFTDTDKGLEVFMSNHTPGGSMTCIQVYRFSYLDM